METIQLTIEELQFIVNKVNEMKSKDNSISNTVEISIKRKSNTYLGNDKGYVCVKSKYQKHVSNFLTFIL